MGTKNLPETMTEADGRVLRRGVRPQVVHYRGMSMTVNLPGYYPDDDSEGVHIGDDMAPLDDALRQLKEQAGDLLAPERIKRIRERAGLGQREAGRLLGVGENTFYKYEHGQSEPSGPTLTLLRLLDKRPDLVDELRQLAA
ncbi:type II toxin-antitoxin system MqsA family antitoxin [Oleisolibacter albus]|uniref:type II toxin-antitoxin system MqsA family antitoxin n=1 Tax=Oleisolibacter albus TaxID=2171757 RepID=UPI000DF40B65|nr:type II toxin-antitoxin system MqsA family antitoxin [Oleisolibacter albus]